MLESLKQAYMPETDFPVRSIDIKKCTKCGRCFDACPTYGYTWQKDEIPVPGGYGGFEQACFNCWNCVAVCPADAITMRGSYSVLKGRYKDHLTGEVTPPEPMGGKNEKSYEDFRAELTEVEHAVYSRRSNRLFKKKDVPEEMLKRIIEAGRFAPSAGNCQPYSFVVLTNKELIKEYETKAMKSMVTVKNIYLNEKKRKPIWKNALFSLGSYLSVNAFDPRPITAMVKAEKNDGKIHFDAPAVIIILKNKRGVGNPDLDSGICAQNIVLAAHSLGLGTCYIGLTIESLKTPAMAGMRRKLGIKDPFEPATSIAVGFPKGKIDGIVARNTPEISWIK